MFLVCPESVDSLEYPKGSNPSLWNCLGLLLPRPPAGDFPHGNSDAQRSERFNRMFPICYLSTTFVDNFADNFVDNFVDNIRRQLDDLLSTNNKKLSTN